MAGQRQRTTRRQKDISRLLREKKYIPPRNRKKDNPFIFKWSSSFIILCNNSKNVSFPSPFITRSIPILSVV